MIEVSLDVHVRQCEHCNAKNIKRTFHIQVETENTFEELYIGRVCIGKLLNIDTSGNPYKARERIFNKLSNQSEQEIIYMIQDLKELV